MDADRAILAEPGSARRSRTTAAGYLFAAAALLAAWCAFANGSREIEGPVRLLSETAVGLYREADLAKTPSRGLQPTTAGGVGRLTLDQPGSCVVRGYARGCNLPLVELPLGAAIALALLAVTAGAALRTGVRGALAAALAGGSLAAAAAALGIANGAVDEADLGTNLRLGRVGLYRSWIDIADPRWRHLSLRELEALERRGGALTVEQPDICLRRRSPACNRVLVEVPLRWALTASLGLGLAAPLPWLLRRARRRDPRD